MTTVKDLKNKAVIPAEAGIYDMDSPIKLENDRRGERKKNKIIILQNKIQYDKININWRKE